MLPLTTDILENRREFIHLWGADCCVQTLRIGFQTWHFQSACGSQQLFIEKRMYKGLTWVKDNPRLELSSHVPCWSRIYWRLTTEGYYLWKLSCCCHRNCNLGSSVTENSRTLRNKKQISFVSRHGNNIMETHVSCFMFLGYPLFSYVLTKFSSVFSCFLVAAF